MTAAFYYSRNLSKVRKILEGFHDGGVLVRRAQEAVKAPNLATQLVEIEEQYSALVDTIQKMEDSRCTIREAYQKMTSLEFGVDGFQIERYIQECQGMTSTALSKWDEVIFCHICTAC